MLRIPRFFLPPFPKGENPPRELQISSFPSKNSHFFLEFSIPTPARLGNSQKKKSFGKAGILILRPLGFGVFVDFLVFFPSGFAGKFQDGNEENQEFLIPLNPSFPGIFFFPAVFPYFSSLDFQELNQTLGKSWKSTNI